MFYIEHKYLPPKVLDESLKDLGVSDKLNIVGHSVLGKPIYSFEKGKGKIRILIWSQMHGNESTSTKSLIDFCQFLLQNENSNQILKKLTFLIIFQLNPDGSNLFTRNNANDIDLNRDAQNLSQPESKLLYDCFKKFKPKYCFNMHGQRSIYNLNNSQNPAVISFLSPPPNKENDLTESRKDAMKLIVKAFEKIESIKKNVVGIYDDTFNANCFGDLFSQLEASTILFEAGHFRNDFERNFSRKLIFESLKVMCHSLIKSDFNKTNYSKYFEIPKNNNIMRDIIISNLTLNIKNKIKKNCKVAIQYQELLVDNRIKLMPIIEDFGKELKYVTTELHINLSSNKIYNLNIGDNAENILIDVNYLKKNHFNT